MKKLANAFIVCGVGSMSLFVLYSVKVMPFNAKESAMILFFTSICIILGLAIHTNINRKNLPREKIYARFIFLSLYFTSITYYFITSLL